MPSATETNLLKDSTEAIRCLLRVIVSLCKNSKFSSAMRWLRSPGGSQVIVATCRSLLCSPNGRGQQFVSSRISSFQLSSLAKDLSTYRVFIVAGESSGDVIGSRLMASLRCLSSRPLEFAGVGGPLMEREGLQSQFPMDDISVMGLVELIPHSFHLWRRLRETIAAAVEFQPNVVITIDTKGFSFRVLRGIKDAYAGRAKCRALAVHYVAPSFWAWKGGEKKLKNLSKIIDHMLCILPFEEAVCRANGLGATFVGHPVLEDAHFVAADGRFGDRQDRNIKENAVRFCERHGLRPGSTLLSVLPGSRLQEVQRMLPIFHGAVNTLNESIRDLTVLIPTAPSKAVTEAVKVLVKNWRVPIVLLPGASETDKYSAFWASTAALCTSGTAVLQLHMAHVPCVTAYRAHIVTEFFIRHRTKLKYISLPNILLDSAVIPEALFRDCTAESLVTHLRPLLEDEEMQKQQVHAAEKVMKILAAPATFDMPSTSRLAPEGFDSSLSPRRPSFVAASSILRLLEMKDSRRI